MRSQAEVDRVLRLARLGFNACRIERQTGIPRSTIRTWLAGATPARGRTRGTPPALNELPPHAYAYLCGLYLGDGCIASYPRDVFKLRIALPANHRFVRGGDPHRHAREQDICQEA